MKAAFAIFQREFKSFFYSPVGFIILAIFTLLTGYFFYSSMAWFINTSFMSDMQAQQFRMQPRAFNVNEMLLRPFLPGQQDHLLLYRYNFQSRLQ